MTRKKSKFRVGSYVVLKTGHAPQEVLEVRSIYGDHWELRCRYVRWFHGSESHQERWRTEEHFVAYEGNPFNHVYEEKPKKENTQMTSAPKLYQTIGENTVFGTFLAFNSVGQIVLEMKPGNVPQAFDKDAVEEVKPYTVSALDHNGRERHFTTAKDKVKENDILLTELGLLFITKINTGFTGEAPELKGRRVLTEEI